MGNASPISVAYKTVSVYTVEVLDSLSVDVESSSSPAPPLLSSPKVYAGQNGQPESQNKLPKSYLYYLYFKEAE